MTPTLLAFCDANNDLRYINLNNVEVIRFSSPSNVMTDRITVRYHDGTAITYDIRNTTTELIQKKLNCFTV